MSIDRRADELLTLLSELRKLPREAAWAEFKHNNDDTDEIGEYLSALSNAAAFSGKVHALLGGGVHPIAYERTWARIESVSAEGDNHEKEYRR